MVEAGGDILGEVDFEAVVEPERAGRFAEILGLARDTVPLVYPAFWLFEPATRALLEAAGGAGAVPIHVGQTFRFAEPLVQGDAYRVHVAARRSEMRGKPSLVVDITARNAAGDTIVEARSTVLIQPLAGGAAR